MINSLTGHKQSLETCAKRSQSLSGENNGMYGKHHSEETRKQMSESKKGTKHPNFGKTHSIKTINKMKESMKNKPTRSCPHCGKTTNSYGNLIRWHFDNCKYKLIT